MKACIITADGKLELKDVPKPVPGKGEVLIRVVTAAQNPGDCKCCVQLILPSSHQCSIYLFLDHLKLIIGLLTVKTVEWLKAVGATVGCDFAGQIEALGPDVNDGEWKIGERVASFVAGGTF
jgi:NADPH:quinone reductase-like Zn-dependent oxidoreductase